MGLSYRYSNQSKIAQKTLSRADNAGHSDHWHILGIDNHTLRQALRSSLDGAVIPKGLDMQTADSQGLEGNYLLLAGNDTCHIKQILTLQDGKPNALINTYPAINSPYGANCTIKEIQACPETQDAILCLDMQGTTVYAFDAMYAQNAKHYTTQSYFVRFGAWAYDLSLSNQDEKIVVDDPKAIRYHRAFNDIVANNGGEVPDDIQEQIRNWQPADNEPLAPVQINLGHSCIYLFGETLGQEDEAWCQGQVLGKSKTVFLGQELAIFDVVILREEGNKPLVARIITPNSPAIERIAIKDYIQANIWLQAHIFAEPADE